MLRCEPAPILGGNLLTSVADSPTFDLLRWTHALKFFSSLERDESEMGSLFPLKVPLFFVQLDFKLFIPYRQGHLASVPCSLPLVPHHSEFSISRCTDGLGMPAEKMLECGAAWPQCPHLCPGPSPTAVWVGRSSP